jgi:membrane protein DedA with SNARE-associated domain
VVPLAAVAAISGDQIGYFLGRWIGKSHPRSVGYQDRVERSATGPRAISVSPLWGAVVFFGRFVVILRTFAALLAGANRMPWRIFLPWNASGGIVWTSLYGFGAYLLGDAANRISGPVGLVLALTGGTRLGFIFVKRNETRLLESAQQVMIETETRDSRKHHQKPRLSL